MAPEKTRQVGMKLEEALIERIDEFAKVLDAERPGATHSRAYVFRYLICRSLNELAPVTTRKVRKTQKRR